MSTNSSNSTSSRTRSTSRPSTSATPPISVDSTITSIFAQPSDSPRRGGGGQGNGNGNGGNGDFGNSSATLYLYTFLATLILLLGVSAAIVLRSLLLRRRHRRMIEEAIRNGTWVPPREGRKVDLSKKPKLWDVYLQPPQPELDEKNGGDGWDGIMPFAVSNLAVGSKDKSDSTSTTNSTSNSNSSLAPRPNIFARRFRRTARHTDVELAPQSPGSTTNITTDPPESNAPIQISVLIAMPSPTPLHKLISQARALGQDEAELPLLEVGTATQEVPPENEKESSSSSSPPGPDVPSSSS